MLFFTSTLRGKKTRTENRGDGVTIEGQMRRPGVHADYKHPVLLLPSGPDKVWAL